MKIETYSKVPLVDMFSPYETENIIGSMVGD